MLYVLEGCDGSGKSTIANHLQKVLPYGAEVVHCTTTTPNDVEFFMGLIEASKTRDIIADRFCYGQFVYQNAGERPLNDLDLIRLETAMLSAGVKVIYVKASVDELEDRLTLRGEKTRLSVQEICDRYDDLFTYQSLISPYVWKTGRDA